MDIDHKHIAQGALDRLCVGAVVQTLVSILVFQFYLARLAIRRGIGRAYNQRSLIK